MSGEGTGPRRWVMWGIPSLIFLIAFFHRAAPGVVAKELMQAFNATGAIVGLLSATYFYAYAGLMIPAGLLVDAFGPRRVVAVGGALMGLGAIAMGVAATSAALFGGRFVVGLGAFVTFVGALKIAATWFPARQFGTLSALTATMGILGSLLSTAPLATLAAAAGWRGAFGIVGAAPLTGFLSDRVLKQRKLPYVALTAGSAAAWGAFLWTLGALPLAGVYALFFVMGVFGAAFVLTWPIGREVNPPHLAGVAVAVANLGGFLGAAVTQGPVGALLDASWTGTMAAGARVYPLAAYRAAFGACALLVVAGLVLALFLRETRGRNVYAAPG